MKDTTKKLTEWAIEKIKTEYLNDVALLIAVEGHCVNEDGHGLCFDHFVPSTERGNELSQTFIINGIGYDLYPRSWERTERTANLEDNYPFALGNAIILYSKSKEDTERFENLRQKLLDNLSNKEFVYKKSIENLDIAMDLYRTVMFEDRKYQVKMASGFIVHYLSFAVTFLNGTYEKDLSNGKIPNLLKLTNRPENFIEYYKAIINTNDVNELKSLSHLIISTTRKFIAKYKTESIQQAKNIDYTGLANWYQEISLWFKRVYYYCDNSNSDAAFYEACGIQSELNIVKEEFALKEMDLLGSFDSSQLSTLSKKALEIENYIVSEIESHNIKIASYKTLEDFFNQNK